VYHTEKQLLIRAVEVWGFEMALNICFSVIGSSEVQASIVSVESHEEAEKMLKEVGAEDEKVLAFISEEGEASDAIAALATCNIESDGSIGHTLEGLLATAFSKGMSYATKVARL
jgi:hypothetical protein